MSKLTNRDLNKIAEALMEKQYQVKSHEFSLPEQLDNLDISIINTILDQEQALFRIKCGVFNEKEQCYDYHVLEVE